MAGVARAKSPGPLQLCEQNGFAHAVFISYPHSISSRGEEIVSKLAIGLEQSCRSFPGMKPGERIFLDKTRLQAGFRWDDYIRSRLVRSAVTIVVLVPTYFESEYCSIEWAITADLEPLRIPPNQPRTCLLPIQLVPQDELDPPDQVRTVQFAKEFEQLLVWGSKVETHPEWQKLVEDLRRIIFDLIKVVCTTNRDWPREDGIAKMRGPFPFTWTAMPSPPPPFPAMKSVEGR